MHISSINKKYIKFIIFLMFIFLVLYVFLYENRETRCKRLHIQLPKIVKRVKDKNEESIQCFHKKIHSLPDISEIEPRKGKSIFFHETSCTSFSRGKIFITARQACAVESAAKLNPNLDVYLLYSSPGIIKYECDQSDLFVDALGTYDNIKIMHVNYEKYTKGTPVESLYTSKKIDQSSHVVEHASDIIRYLSLWKYGGIYLDLDVVVLESLQDLKLNFAAIESEQEIAAGVLSFTPDGTGHKWAEACLNDLKAKFDGNAWSDSSTGVISRLLRSVCNVTSSFTPKECSEYTLYPTKKFYPLYYTEWNFYFQENHLQKVLNMTKNSTAIHMWNKLSKDTLIPINNDRVPYLHFAKKFCPKVVNACYEYF